MSGDQLDLDALSRVGEFSRQWAEQIRKLKGGKTDLIYSVHFDIDAEAVDLLNSDLLALVDEVRRLRAEVVAVRAPVSKVGPIPSPDYTMRAGWSHDPLPDRNTRATIVDCT